MNMSLLPVQLFFLLLLFWPISKVWLRFKDGGVSFGMFLFWTAIWGAAVISIFFPDFLTYAAKAFGVSRGSDLAIYLAVLVLFYLIFRTNVILENLQHKVSQIVQAMALMEAKQDQEKSKTKPLVVKKKQ